MPHISLIARQMLQYKGIIIYYFLFLLVEMMVIKGMVPGILLNTSYPDLFNSTTPIPSIHPTP